MKTFFSAAVLLLACAAAARAESLPDRVNFQGKLINPATNNPQAGPASLTFKLYDVPTGGAALYTETQNNVPLVNGVFSVQIGTTSAISRELFLGASVYLGVTVVGDAGGEMVPRQELIMSAYAFTAHQLSDASDVRLVAGTAYSTFTSAGNLIVPGGVEGSSGSFTNGIMAGSGTFTATGGSQFSLETSSGILVDAGTLSVNGSGGIDAGGVPVFAGQFFGVGASSIAVKAAAESVTSSAVLQPDNALALPVGANQIWAVTGLIEATSTSATPDIKVAFAVPAGSTMLLPLHGNGATAATFADIILNTSGTAGTFALGANIPNPIYVSGTVITAATPGFLQFQWAQNTSNGTASTVSAGSYLMATRVK